VATITSDQATALAEAFLKAKRGGSPLGELASVKHGAPRSPESGYGEYRVEFAYAGPPVRQGTTPPRDHPTVVFVNDATGACQLMLWM